MKKYKVVVSQDNEDLRDLVNINDNTDTIPIAPDNFNAGDIVTEDDFFLEDSNYVDENGAGTMLFAFEKE